MSENLNINDKSVYTCYVREDLIKFGGDIISIFYPVIEFNDGKRIAHFQEWKDDTEALKVLDRVKERGYIDLDYWNEIDPVYGSKYFQENDGEKWLF